MKQNRNLIKIVTFLLLMVMVSTSLFVPYVFCASPIEIVYGDVTGDGKVNVADYTLMRRFLLRIITEFPVMNWEIIADIKPDGAINSGDFTVLRRYILGIINKLPYSETPATASPTSTPTPTLTPTPTSTSTSTPIPTLTPKPTPTLTPKSSSTPLINEPIYKLIGKSKQEVINTYGQFTRTDLSEYGFNWHIYNQDYSKYMQVGIQNDKVVGIYTNSASYDFLDDIKVGTDKSEVARIFGTPLKYIKKGNVLYYLNSLDEREVYNVNDSFYATIFYDIHNQNKVTSILIIDKNTEHSLAGYYGNPSEELSKSFERQTFDLVNSIRVRNGKKAFTLNEKVAEVARAHSEDMVLNNYFSHTNLQGKSPFDRMTEAGLRYTAAAENIAKGQVSAIYAHEGWMNSSGHRSNILGNCSSIGVGVFMGEKGNICYTQNFITPR